MFIRREKKMNERDQKICDNRKLVNHVIWRFYPHLGTDDDIFQIGCVGLIKAVDTFDLANGAAFSSYAVQCIRNEIRMELRKRKRWDAPLSLEMVLAESEHDQLLVSDILGMDDEYHDLVIGDYERLLDSRERLVLHYLLAGKTQLWIAKTIGTSRQNVGRIVKKMREKYSKGV